MKNNNYLFKIADDVCYYSKQINDKAVHPSTVWHYLDSEKIQKEIKLGKKIDRILASIMIGAGIGFVLIPLIIGAILGFGMVAGIVAVILAAIAIFNFCYLASDASFLHKAIFERYINEKDMFLSGIDFAESEQCRELEDHDIEFSAHTEKAMQEKMLQDELKQWNKVLEGE